MSLFTTHQIIVYTKVNIKINHQNAISSTGSGHLFDEAVKVDRGQRVDKMIALSCL